MPMSLPPPAFRSLNTAFLCSLIFAVSSAVSAAEPPGGSPRLGDYFGFQPLEIYKLERRIGNLMIKDLDGDKTGDIIVGNNARSRIDLLLSGKRPAEEIQDRPFRTEVNEIEYDRRMRLSSIPVNKEVVSIDTGDFNGDGKPDLVYYGTPAEVEILFNDGSGRFSSGKKISAGEAREVPSALAVGDLDQDGRDDIALLAENDLIFVYQTAPGVLSEPERVPHTASNPHLLKVVDLDGDGSGDLVILDGGTDHPIHVRFGTDEKKLGPEQRFQVEPPRAIAFGQIDGQGGSEVLTIEGKSGRCRVLTLDDSSADEQNKWGRLVFFGLPQAGDRGRSLAVGDLDGDKHKDVMVTDPANAQIWLYRQNARSGLNAGQAYPGLLGGRTVRLADLDRDGKDEVYVLSEQEKQIGRSRLENGRVSFPSPLPIIGEPVAMDLTDLDGDQACEVLYIVKAKTPSGSDGFALRALKRDPSGDFRAYSWGQADTVNVPGLSSTPTALQSFDVNQDGVNDLIVFSGYGSPILLLGQKGQPPKVFSGSLGPMGAATPAGLSLMRLDGAALMVAQNTFARHVALDSKGQWQIKDQYNSGRSSAQIQGVAALDLTGDGRREIVLFDRTSKSLLMLSPKDGVYRPAGSLSVGALNFEGLHVADLDGDGRDDLLIAGTDRFGVLQTGSKGRRLRTIASYESKRNEARLADLATGDLNADGVPDVVFTDIADQMLELATYAGGKDLLHALSFKVFERKLYRGTGDLAEPRDLATGDVDGDHHEDIVLVAHDRILILRQDPGGPGQKGHQARAKTATAAAQPR
jgi:hypothetical protein